MSAIQERVKGAIRRVGDSFTVAGNARIGWFRICSYGRALLYATVAEVDGYSKPLRTLTVPHDDVTAVGDTVAWDGLSLSVKKVAKVRFDDETVAKVLLIA